MNEPNPPASSGESAEDTTQIKRKRRKVTTACSACQQRKTKCSGTTPCDACASRDTQCVYDVSSDQRRKLASRRNLQDLSEARGTIDRYQKLLGGIIAVLRAGSNESIDGLLATVRSGVDLSQIAAHVRNALRAEQHAQVVFDEIVFQLDGAPDLPSPTQLLQADLFTGPPGVEESQQRFRQSDHPRGNLATVINPPITVPAYPWTTVTNSDDLVSHLISLWFTWTYPWWYWVNKDLFVEAMRQQDMNSPFCTPYLVNMILADACVLDEIHRRGDLRQQFLAQAVLGLEQHKGPASLATIQAMGIQWTHLNTHGEDRAGLPKLAEQNDKFAELEEWRAQLENLHSSARLQKVDQCLDQLAWTIYLTNGLSLMSHKQAVPPDTPLRSMPPSNCQGQQLSIDPTENPWIPYPDLNEALPFHHSCHFRNLLTLAKIVCEDEAALRRSAASSPFTVDRFYKAFEALRDWPRQLPDCMKLVEGSTPHVIALHAVHNWTLITIYKQAIAAEEGHFDQPLLMQTPISSNESVWKPLCQKSAIMISSLMSLHRRKWGSEYFPNISIQPISVALFVLLNDLNFEDNRSAFINLCSTMHAASRRQKAGMGVLNLVQRTARDHGIQLPVEVDRFFARENVEQEWSQREDHDTDIDIDYLLGKWQDLSLNKQN